MAYGRVLRMHKFTGHGKIKTLNAGRLRDMNTGIEYDFNRPDHTGTGDLTRWNVDEGDIVTFDIENGEATNVALCKNLSKRVVWRYN